MAFKPPKRFKRFKIYLKRANLKIALGFRYAQTLLNLAIARFVGAIFRLMFPWIWGKAEARSKATRNSLRS